VCPFCVNVVASNPKDEASRTPPVEALIGSGSELTRLPAEEIRSIGITPLRSKTFVTASNQRIVRTVGYAVLAAESFEAIDELVFVEPRKVAQCNSANTMG
jgi:hypothetical protein